MPRASRARARTQVPEWPRPMTTMGALAGELLSAQGKPVDMGGYYHPDTEKMTKAMRPSPTLNAIVDAIA